MHTADLRVLLEEMGKRPNKRLGQNFLIDQSVVHAALEAGDVQKGDTVLEVGPGLGVLTEALLEQGASVIAIEKDRAFAERLTFLHPGANSHLRVIEGDAAEMDWIREMTNDELRMTDDGLKKNSQSAIRNPQLPWKFIANIPYSITSLLLRKALWCEHPPSLGVVLIQKEVAERCMGCFKKDGDRSLLSLMIGLSCSSAHIVRNVPPRCFYPPPKVDSAVFIFTPMSIEERQAKWGIDPEEVMKVAKAGFAHPRKMLASNLRSRRLAVGSWQSGTEVERGEIENLLISLGLSPKARAEELSLEQWAALTKGMR